MLVMKWLAAFAVLVVPATGCDDFVLYTELDGFADSNGVPDGEAGPLEISPVYVTLPINGRITFSATGGVPPYKYTIVDGGGSIDKLSGKYSAPDQPDKSTIRVTDYSGATNNALVLVLD